MKEHFPIFSEERNGKKLVYFDSAATAHKPESVVNAISHFYSSEYASAYRGLYSAALDATAKVEETRSVVADFISCATKEVIFTHSATESMNLLSYSLGETYINEGDEILVSVLEHHSNYLPWQELCKRKGARFVTFGIHKDGTIDLKDLRSKLSEKTKVVAISHQSNVLGIVNPVKEIAEIAHNFGALVVVDGAQQVAHDKVDVKALDADFYVFSGHKMYGPTGVGVLYGRYDLLDKMEPFHSGGGMVETIEENEITYRKPPYKFEAGTPMIASIIGLKKAIEFINDISFEKIRAKEMMLSMMLYDGLKSQVQFLTPHHRGSSILTFTVNGMHASDVAMMLSLDNISVRAGNLCAQPLLNSLGKKAVVRLSIGMYNDEKDVKTFLSSLSSLTKVT